ALGGAPGSTWYGKVTAITSEVAVIKKADVGMDAVAGDEYKVKFKHKWAAGDGVQGFRFEIHQALGPIQRIVYYPINAWTEESFRFTATNDGAVQIWVDLGGVTNNLQLDQFSIQEFIPYWKRYYELLAVMPDSKGPYHVTLAGVDVWQGEEDEGWYYAKAAQPGPPPESNPPAHPAEVVFFDPNKTVPSGEDVIISYFTEQVPEEVVADLLVLAGITDELETTATEIIIDQVWFKEGTTCLEAIKMLCERCNYRFHFKYDGTPVFKLKPAVDAEVKFTFTDPKHIASINTYQDRSEIKNRI
ncbi:unnamed protein product, partial [marine sediment metagenome]